MLLLWVRFPLASLPQSLRRLSQGRVARLRFVAEASEARGEGGAQGVEVLLGPR